jgi:DNA primase large subunit
VKSKGTVEDIHLLAKSCIATATLISDLQTQTDPSHEVRRSLAQLGISLGLTDDQLAELFAQCSDFNERITRTQIASLRRRHKRPSCRGFSEVTGACTGQCDRSVAAKTKSPVGIIAWKYLAQQPKGGPFE